MIGIIIQARTGSRRFPRKIYEDLNGKYTLQRVLEGCKGSKLVNRIVLAMPEYDKEEFYERSAKGEFKPYCDSRFGVYFGSSDDLIDRYFNAAIKYDISLIVRITADCPTIQPEIIDRMLIEYLKNGHNGFMGNNEFVSSIAYPHGTDVEIFPLWLLAEIHREIDDRYDREHVTKCIYRDRTKYSVREFHNKPPNPVLDMKFKDFAFDTQKDLEVLLELTKYYDEYKDLDTAIKMTKYTDNKGRG